MAGPPERARDRDPGRRGRLRTWLGGSAWSRVVRGHPRPGRGRAPPGAGVEPRHDARRALRLQSLPSRRPAGLHPATRRPRPARRPGLLGDGRGERARHARAGAPRVQACPAPRGSCSSATRSRSGGGSSRRRPSALGSSGSWPTARGPGRGAVGGRAGLEHRPAVPLSARCGAWPSSPTSSCSPSGENDLAELAFNRLTLDEGRLPVRVEPMLRMIDATGRMRYLGRGRAALPAGGVAGRDVAAGPLAPLPLAALPAGEGLGRGWPSGGRSLRRRSGSERSRPARSAACRRTISSARWRRAPSSASATTSSWWRPWSGRRARAASRCARCSWPTAARPGRPTPCWRASTTRVRPAREACFDSARVISAAETARFTFAHDSHWNREGHQRIADAWRSGSPASRRSSGGRDGGAESPAA